MRCLRHYNILAQYAETSGLVLLQQQFHGDHLSTLYMSCYYFEPQRADVL
jgi:hypothetical protein